MTTMHAWRIHGYGGADALVCDDVPIPTAGAGELLLRVRVASVNPIDWKIREGMLAAVLPMRLPITLGRDCVGEVVAIGGGVTEFAIGDRVLALAAHGRDGTHADYCVLPAAQAARVPAEISDADAVCLGVAGLSASIPLVEMANITAGSTVLIHAGAGGVGHVAVQIAKRLGARVVTTCSARNFDYVRGLGADLAIDYASRSLAAVAGEIDIALDSIGGETHALTIAAMRSGGRVIALSAAPLPANPRGDVEVVQARIVATTARLDALLRWMLEGRLHAEIDALWPFDRAREAYERSRIGPIRGKLVLSVG